MGYCINNDAWTVGMFLRESCLCVLSQEFGFVITSKPEFILANEALWRHEDIF